MAWTEKLPSGKYRAVYRDHDGKRRSAGTFTHAVAARRAGNEAEAGARRAGWRSPDAARQTWAQWCARWWPTRNVEPSTLRSDTYRLNKHLVPRWGNVELADITRHDIRAWAADLRAGHAPSTVQRIVHLLSASLNAAVDAEILQANPAEKLKLPRPQEAAERFLTAEDIDAIAEHMPTERDRTILYLLAYTGMRWGEMAGLHWNRVDFNRERIEVAETLDDRSREIKAYPKGKRTRFVPVPAFLLEMIGPPTAGPCGLVHRTGRCRSGLVALSPEGKPLHSRNWRRVFDRAVEDAGLDHAWPHMSRHAYASWLAQQGVPLAEIGKLLGHQSVVTTQRYAHLYEDQSAAVLALPTPRQPKRD